MKGNARLEVEAKRASTKKESRMKRERGGVLQFVTDFVGVFSSGEVDANAKAGRASVVSKRALC